MFIEFFHIILRSIKLDRSLYKENKNFGDASIYYAITIILITSIISMIPGSTFIQHMSISFNITDVKGPSMRSVIIMSFCVWVIKTTYLYIVGVLLFPSKLTKCTFKKFLIVVAYANTPFIFYIFIFDIQLLYFTFVPYTWYCISLIIGVNQVLKYENHFKSAIISLAPQIILFVYFFSQVSNINSGTFS